MKSTPLARGSFVFAVAFFLSALVCGDGTAWADGIKVRVLGSGKISARASRDTSQGGTDLVLSGSLSDDSGQPLFSQNVVVTVARESDAHDTRVAEGLRGARGCDRTADGAPGGAGARVRGATAWSVRVAGSADSPEVVTTTDEEGRFCFRARLDPDRYRATLAWTPKNGTLIEGVKREIAFDLSKRALALRFDPTPRIVNLDTPRTVLEAVAIVDDDGTPRVAPGIALALANEKNELGRVVTDASGRARFSIDAAKLGPPGPGELRVSFAGDGSETAQASHAEEIERHVKVALKVPAADRGELSAQVPEDGIPITVEISSAAGPVGEGSVEARIGDVLVGAAPAERGIARLLLTFTAQGSEALVRLRYVPAAPWYEPLGEPSIRIPIRGPGLLSKAPILVAGLAVLVFFLAGRIVGKNTKPEPKPEKDDDDVREAKPGVEVVRAAGRGESGWTGRVIDAHEGTAVKNARVWIERGTFEGRSVLVTATTGADGRFVLDPISPVVGDEQIYAEGPLHARLGQALPPAGEIAIALAERRRALLARLVSWAKRRGPPFDTRPEPTPGHVRRAAREEPDTARWAEAVEKAAFGPGTVDARAEKEIDRLAPDDPPRD